MGGWKPIRPKVKRGAVRRRAGESAAGGLAECANCGAELSRGAVACPDCGSDAATGWSEGAGFELPEFGYEVEGAVDDAGLLAASARRRRWWVRIGIGLVVVYLVVRLLRGTLF